jgi:hypothetical protein
MTNVSAVRCTSYSTVVSIPDTPFVMANSEAAFDWSIKNREHRRIAQHINASMPEDQLRLTNLKASSFVLIAGEDLCCVNE